MAIYKKGADPVALRSAADRLTGHARDCDSVRGEAARAIGSLKGHWGGGDLDHLMMRWPPVEAQLTAFGTDLGKLAEALRRNAGQQDTVSGPPVPLGPWMPLGPGLPGVPGAPPGPAGPAGPGGPGGSGGSGGDGDNLLEDIFNGDWLVGVNAAQNFSGLLASGLGLVGHYKNLDDFLMAADTLGGSNWKTLVQGGMAVEDLSPGVARLASTMGVVGKAIGPIGAALSWGSVAADVSAGNYDRAGYDTVMAGLGTAALLTPPPANLICGGLAATMGVGQLLYDNWDGFHDFVDGGVDLAGDAVDAVGDFGGDVADAAGDAWDAVTPW